MTNTNTVEQLAPAKSVIRRLFENPALIPGEYASDYRFLAKHVCSALRVETIWEALLARDIVNLDWEIQRWRKVQTAVLTPPGPDLTYIARLQAIHGKDHAQSVLDEAYAKSKRPEALAERYVDHASALEQLDRTIAALEIRRSNAWREFHRNRQVAKRRSSLVADDVIEADYVEMPREAA